MRNVAGRSGFLGTRVGRRTLADFLTAAMLPVLVSSLTGIWYVRRSLESEATNRVQRTSKSVAMIVINELNHFAERADFGDAAGSNTYTLSRDDSLHLHEGRPLLRLLPPGPDGERQDPSLQLIRRLASGEFVSQTTRPEAFWDALDESAELDRTSLCLMEVGTWRRVFCSNDMPAETESVLRALATSDTTPGDAKTIEAEGGTQLAPQADSSVRRAEGGSVNGTVGRGDDALLVARRDVFLGFEWGTAAWRLVTAESRAAALAPARSVTTSLLLLIGLALVSAFMMAHRQIRRSTEPLEALRDATRRVEAGDLETPVTITTRDEYGDLGMAFNGMTGALAKQLDLLHRMDAVDDATLRERQVEAIVRTALRVFATSSQWNNPSVSIRGDVANLGELTQYWTDERTGHLVHTVVAASEQSTRLLLEQPRHFRAATSNERGAFAAAEPHADGLRIVLPLLHDNVVLGAITVDATSSGVRLDEAIAELRRLADRVALGLSNVRLLNLLDAMSTGTLRAFARAIDANSAWTAGHSERVTHVAMALGQSLGLSPGALSTLYRGGLMHDIGKIGIPATILDKAGKLSPDERAIIEQHPVIGARILAPIAGFADALPIVRSHHERIDGTGYPDRLAGDGIPWLARVLSVADVFDALVSDRPYRAGLSHRAAISVIEAQSGSAFDPRVVGALLRVQYSDVLTRTPSNILEEFSVAGLAAPNDLGESGVAIVTEEPLALV